MKRLVILFLAIINLGFSQENLSPKKALTLSKQYKERAQWFLSMPQYNQDSANHYSARAIAILDANIDAHRSQIARLKFDQLRGNYLNLAAAGEDSLARIRWPEYQRLIGNTEENRVLQYDFLVHWANVKLRQGKTKESLELFKKAMSLIDKKDSRDTHAKTIIDKALYYGRYGLPDETKLSYQYLHKSRVYFNKDPQKYATELYMVNAELVYYFYSKNRDSMDYYFQQVGSILKYYQRPLAHLWYHVMYGKSLIERERYSDSEPHIYEALQIMNRYNIRESETFAGCYEMLAKINLSKKQYDSAIVNYSKAREEYLKENNQYATPILEHLADTYQQKGDLANALKFKDQFYRESLEFERLRNERSLRENELQVDLLTREKELTKKHNQQIIYIVALGIGTIVLLLLYRNYRLKQRNNRKLEAVNNELESKNQLLDKRNAENELLLKEIHHRVKNNLEVVSSLLALQSAQIDDPNTKDAMIESQNRVNSIGIVHQKLYQGANLGCIEMKDYFINLGEGILDTFNVEDKIQIECIMDDLELDIDTAVPIGLIVNELLTNSLKYAFPENTEGKISISLLKNPQELTLKVSDNGIGKTLYDTPKGTGFGTQLLQLLTIQLNGVMEELSGDGTATLFRFKLKAA